MRQHAHAFGCVQQVRTRLSDREFLRSINSFKFSAPRSIYMLQKLIKAAYLLLSARSTIYPLEKSNLALRSKRMRDVHAHKRMFFARFARSSCQNIQMWELYRSQACLQYDERNSRPRKSFQCVPNPCHQTDTAT